MQSVEDANWSYLRANLDNPRYYLLRKFAAELASWKLFDWRPAAERPRRLEVVARIPIGPHQSVALIEADEVRVLAAISGDGAVSIFPIPEMKPAEPMESFAPNARNGVAWDTAVDEADHRQTLMSTARNRRGKGLGALGRVSW